MFLRYVNCELIGAFLNRAEAVSVLKDIFEKTSLFHFKCFSLMRPNGDGLRSRGYQVHVKAYFDRGNQLDVMREIAKKHGLTLEIENEGTVIFYRPLK